MRSITVGVEGPASAEARELIAQLDGYQAGLYPAQSMHLLPVEALGRPDVTFLVARVDGRAAGCGAFVNHGGEYAEIKRMFVLPQYRGLGLGRRILQELETRIRSCGLTLARLETGAAQPEALRLYEGAGYQRRGPYGGYRDDPLCVFMEKALTSPAPPARPV